MLKNKLNNKIVPSVSDASAGINEILEKYKIAEPLNEIMTKYKNRQPTHGRILVNILQNIRKGILDKKELSSELAEKLPLSKIQTKNLASDMEATLLNIPAKKAKPMEELKKEKVKIPLIKRKATLANETTPHKQERKKPDTYREATK